MQDDAWNEVDDNGAIIGDVDYTQMSPSTPTAPLLPKTTPPPTAPSAEELRAAAEQVWLA